MIPGEEEKKGYTQINQKWVPKCVLFGNPWLTQSFKKSVQKTQMPYSLHDFYYYYIYIFKISMSLSSFTTLSRLVLKTVFRVLTLPYISLNFYLDFDQTQKANQLKSYSLWLGRHLYLQISMEIKSISAKSEHRLLGTKVKQHNQGILFHLTLWN